MLSVSEVSKMFLVEPQTIRDWAKKGILTVDFQTPTKRKYFNEEQIEKLIKK